MPLLKWKTKEGLEKQTNDLPKTVEYCESMGWKQSGKVKEPKPEKPKPSRDSDAAE